MNIKNIIAGSSKTASKFFFLLVAFTCVISMASCSESDGAEDEYENWESRNDVFFNNIYDQAEKAINAGSKDWKIIRSYSKNTASSKTDYIVVHIEKEGTGTESPIFTDSVRVHYRGRLISSANYPEGKIFDSSWTGEYDQKTMRPTDFILNVGYTGYAQNATIGFTTALMNMHKGDRWTVYIPYALGHGIYNFTPNNNGTAIGSPVPAYSTLIYDVTLVDYVHAGENLPLFQ